MSQRDISNFEHRFFLLEIVLVYSFKHLDIGSRYL